MALCVCCVFLLVALIGFANGISSPVSPSSSSLDSNGKDILTNHRIVPFSKELSLDKEDAINATANPPKLQQQQQLPPLGCPLLEPIVKAAPAQKICTTPGCVLSAASLISGMDMSVDPCQDFYKFTCGKWIARHVIPEDKSQYGVFDVLEENLQINLKEVLENTTSSGIDAVEKVKNIYKACMNETVINALGVQPGLDFLKATNPWPVVQPELYNESSYDLIQSIANLNRIGESAIIAVSVQPDSKNATKRVLYVDQPKFGMPNRDYLLRGSNDTSVQVYLQFMTQVAAIMKLHNSASFNDTPSSSATQKLLAPSHQTALERDMLNVLEFEIKLANISTSKELRRDPLRLYNNMTIAQLSQRVPGFDWLRLLRAYSADNHNRNIDENEVIVVAEPEFLGKVIKLVQQTPKRTLANYLGWRSIRQFVFEMGQVIQEPRLRYLKVLFGRQQDPPRWKSCIDKSKVLMVFATGRVFVEKYFDSKSKAIADTMITRIQEAFRQELDEIEWLGTEERKMSIEKAHAMLNLIGYDNMLLNNTWLNQRHELNSGNVSDHFANMALNLRANDEFEQRRLRIPVNRSDWDIQPADVNAFYNPNVNTIMFLAGILQEPFFAATQPMAVNFGAIGLVMGHEITHGFDDQGRHFDKNGQLSDWWKPETAERFKNKSQCVVDYYNKFAVEPTGMNVNGEFTLGENLADLGGIRLAHRAYKNYLAAGQIDEDEKQSRLPGLQNFTNDQIFFMGSAAVWCIKQRPEKLKALVLTDEHSPAEFRVIGAFANMPQFATTFGCKAGSYMNPTNKCRVW